MEYEVGDIVLCTVEKISGTIVFVTLNDSKNTQGSIIMSEIAPGRIRNIREYVVPKKRIVCKIIRINPGNGNIDLSLRRVTQKEKKEVLEKEKQEKSYKQILKSVLESSEKTNEVTKKILENSGGNLYEFFEEAKQNPKPLEKLVPKESADKIIDIIKAQKQKVAVVKKEFSLSTKNPEGITLIKKLLSEFSESKGKTDEEKIEIKYISAGKYRIKNSSDNPKNADKKIKEVFKEIEEKSKKLGLDFSYKDK